MFENNANVNRKKPLDIDHSIKKNNNLDNMTKQSVKSLQINLSVQTRKLTQSRAQTPEKTANFKNTRSPTRAYSVVGRRTRAPAPKSPTSMGGLRPPPHPTSNLRPLYLMLVGNRFGYNTC